MKLSRLVFLPALALATVCDGTDCVALPCALTIAITVTVVSSATGAPVSGAFVQENAQSSAQPCNQAPGTTCNVLGHAGSYQLTIGAPGYQSVVRAVDVPSGASSAGCPSVCSVKPQHLDVGLTPAP